jgi:hypothetical protein
MPAYTLSQETKTTRRTITTTHHYHDAPLPRREEGISHVSALRAALHCSRRSPAAEVSNKQEFDLRFQKRLARQPSNHFPLLEQVLDGERNETFVQQVSVCTGRAQAHKLGSVVCQPSRRSQVIAIDIDE